MLLNQPKLSIIKLNISCPAIAAIFVAITPIFGTAAIIKSPYRAPKNAALNCHLGASNIFKSFPEPKNCNNQELFSLSHSLNCWVNRKYFHIKIGSLIAAKIFKLTLSPGLYRFCTAGAVTEIVFSLTNTL